jgi:hypothetical protein
MQKLLVLSLIVSLAVSHALFADEDEGIGLSAGLEFGIVNIGKANDEERYPYLMPMLIYENSFLDDSLEFYAELDYIFGFTKEPNDEGNEVFPQSLYFDLMVGYNLGLGSASTLSFILENEFDEIIISPRFKESNALTGIFTPAVKFTQSFDFGDLFAQVGVPITYVQYDKDADTEVGIDSTLGWNSSFGLGIEIKVLTLIAPRDISGFNGLEALIGYEYVFRNFTFYAKCEFTGIGIKGEGMCVSPALGVKYSF